MRSWKWYLAIAAASFGTYACNSNLAIPPTEEQPVSEGSKPSRETAKSPPREIEFTVLEPKTRPNRTDRQEGVDLPEVDPLKVEGSFSVAGSSAVFPVVKTTSERFVEEGYAGIAEIASVGSGEGFEIFCKEGKSEIATASRPIRPAEVRACAEIGRKPIEFSVGVDALTVVVHPDNDFLENATLEELARIFTAEKWSDVNPAWPDETIRRFVPDPQSGAFDIFVGKVFDGNKELLSNVPNSEFFREDEDFLVQSISTNPYSIGFFSYAYYRNNKDLLKSVSIDGIRPGVDNNYPLTRPLLLYSDAGIIRDKPQVAAFLNYFFIHVNEQIIEVGYFLPSQETLDAEKIELLKAQGYEAFFNSDSSEAP